MIVGTFIPIIALWYVSYLKNGIPDMFDARLLLIAAVFGITFTNVGGIKLSYNIKGLPLEVIGEGAYRRAEMPLGGCFEKIEDHLKAGKIYCYNFLPSQFLERIRLLPDEFEIHYDHAKSEDMIIITKNSR